MLSATSGRRIASLDRGPAQARPALTGTLGAFESADELAFPCNRTRDAYGSLAIGIPPTTMQETTRTADT